MANAGSYRPQAPEVFIGNYGLEADMWAAGMMMYQLLVAPHRPRPRAPPTPCV